MRVTGLNYQPFSEFKRTQSVRNFRIKNVENTQSHTLEFYSNPRHDTNFNDKKKTTEESWAASVILKNAEHFGGGYI